MKSLEEDSEFHEALKSFVQTAEVDVMWLLEEEKRIMALVKSTGDYFHGNAGKDEGLRLFVIVRDFLIILDKFCIWLWKLGGRVLDREIEIISDEDDHPATTKPQLTAEALEEEFPSFTRWQISDENPRRRVVDIELAIIWNEDDHSEPAAAAAPTKPQLTAEALEEAFPTFAHGKIVKSDECAICLEEFKEGEKCRMLVPSCVHIFHKDCIDIWLSEDTRCPLCRAVLFSSCS
ncbi:hypothetical protein GH714_008387 [Hevea brasiliensis]|uniref:RING-type domain-containing protein n=1 Tax=Hevea brasiliensis TaxID=3981 RepID=A0A6A6KBR5_HEVBR|nr:hypothetical protein GH714_008387 [Hevea brasiliensis]